jgi:hypothetical protein
MRKLIDADAAGFEVHVLRCARCRQFLEWEDAFVRAMRRAAAEIAGG